MMPWLSRQYFEFVLEQNVKLQERVSELEAELRAETERHRQHELTLVDRILTKNGSRPATPVVDDAPLPPQRLTPEQEAFKADWEKEFREVMGVGYTPADNELIERKWQDYLNNNFDPARPL